MIYFIQQGDAGPIKIGRAWNPRLRRSELQVGSPLVCTLLVSVVVQDDIEAEAELHRRFDHLHIRGEWFTPAPDLLDYIRSVYPQSPEAAEAKEKKYWADLYASGAALIRQKNETEAKAADDQHKIRFTQH